MVVTGSVDSPIIGIAGDPKSLDEGRELLHCPIHHPKLNELIAAMPGLIRRHELTPYRIQARSGELKALIAFYSPLSDQMYLRFVLRSRAFVTRITKLIPELQRDFPSLRCISANIQPIPHAILEGPEEIPLTRPDWILHQIGSLQMRLAPQAFVQTNFVVAAELYETAARWVGEISPPKMIELFCGQGAFSFFCAKSAATILGIEINPEAVETANRTATEQNLPHLRFKAADSAKVGSEIGSFAPDLILANPPRKGLGESLRLISEFQPAHFIYSSCAIETLASDLERLAPLYRIRKARLFDMFPHTEHFETLVWLEKTA